DRNRKAAETLLALPARRRGLTRGIAVTTNPDPAAIRTFGPLAPSHLLQVADCRQPIREAAVDFNDGCHYKPFCGSRPQCLCVNRLMLRLLRLPLTRPEIEHRLVRHPMASVSPNEAQPLSPAGLPLSDFDQPP